MYLSLGDSLLSDPSLTMLAPSLVYWLHARGRVRAGVRAGAALVRLHGYGGAPVTTPSGTYVPAHTDVWAGVALGVTGRLAFNQPREAGLRWGTYLDVDGARLWSRENGQPRGDVADVTVGIFIDR